MRTIRLENQDGDMIEVVLDYSSYSMLLKYGTGVPKRLKGKLVDVATESDGGNFKVPLDYFFKYYPEYNIPNNKLSRQVYKNMIPSECGKYLIKEIV